MKAILNQFIGGGPRKGDMMSAAGSGSQKVTGDQAGANTSSFIGVMMGFLGMNETRVPAANSKGAAFSETIKEGDKSATGSSIHGVPGESKAGKKALTQDNKSVDDTLGLGILNEIYDASNGKAATLKSVKEGGKNKTNLLSAADKLETHSGQQPAENGSAATSSTAVAAEGEGTMMKSAASADESVSGKLQAANKEGGAKGKTAKTLSGNITQQLQANGDTGTKKNSKGEQNRLAERTGLSAKGAANSKHIKPTAAKGGIEKIPAPVAGEISFDGKEQAASQKRTASRVQAENITKQSAGDKGQLVNEGKKNPVAAAGVIKKVQQKQAKKLKMKAERSRAPEATARRSAVQGSQPSPSPPASVQNTEGLLRKPAANVKNLAPGKMIAPDGYGKIGAETDADGPLSRESGRAPEKGFREIHLNDFKSTRLADAAGRKKFSRRLGDISRQQTDKSRETARQTTRWKQHRFVLKDGKAINISARSADGALQLQLNAGNGELSKVLHQHLQEIRQHVQQELNIKVDLQLQDFSGQHSNRENEAGSSSSAPTSGTLNSGESSAVAASATSTSSGTEGVRYFGFNNNEWTA